MTSFPRSQSHGTHQNVAGVEFVTRSCPVCGYKHAHTVEQEAARLLPEPQTLMMPTRLLRNEWPPNDGVRAGNARFDGIFESVQREGIREPLTINLGWFVLDGNHRLSAARHLGLEWVPVRVWTGVEFLP